MIVLGMMDVVVGLLFLGLCIPLMPRKIGRNGVYGFETPRTLASDEVGYAVNHGAAKAGVYLSIGMVIFGVVLPLLPATISENVEDGVLCAAVGAPLVLVLGLVVIMNIELRKLDSR
jgi:SdpI/YfhL protein family